MNRSKKSVILKFSGESLADTADKKIFNYKKLDKLAEVIIDLKNNGFNVGIVIGAGNIFRGKISSDLGIEHEDGDYMGMVGTIINCKALSSILKAKGYKTIVLSALKCEDVAEKYTPELAKKLFIEGNILFFAGGIGLPFYTTDTCVAQRAIDVGASLILVGKNGVDGVYSDDPNKNKDAKFLEKLSYEEILNKNLQVMDRTAIELLKDSDIITKVFSMDDESNFLKVAQGYNIGTTISKEN